MSLVDKFSKRALDLDERSGVPMRIYWSTEIIAEWMEYIGYPQYRECITKNFITGRHLICLDASKLPTMGITDFEHIKDISARIRELIELKYIIKNMNISMADPMIAYMEMKRRTGKRTDRMTFEAFMQKYWRWFY